MAVWATDSRYLLCCQRQTISLVRMIHVGTSVDAGRLIIYKQLRFRRAVP